MWDSFGKGGYKNHLKIANTYFLCNHLALYLTTNVGNNLDYLQFFRETKSVFEKFQLVKL